MASAAELWDRLRSVAPLAVRAMLADMSIVRLDGGCAVVACDERIRAIAEKKMPELGGLMSSVAGRPITAELADAAIKPVPTSPASSSSTSDEVEIDDPIVRHALDVFHGRIVEVKPLPKSDEKE